eukprot:Phypoly_transcript_12942.p1 GENE.Phypoly_transcript_12942~~Phypoly_transcript_12942.p1  ORF type:complete len:343 (+),score=42.39 Phypoly_transcript_12942:67-1095(+)
MKRAGVFLALVCACAALFVPPDNQYIQYSGRIDEHYTYEWSGIEIYAQFTGTSIGVILQDLSTGGNMYNAFVDGTLVTVLNATEKNTTFPIAHGLAAQTHSVLITKRTEAFYGPGVFLGFEIDDGASLVAPPPVSSRRIEFIGDSITCGFGAEGTAPCPYTKDTENAYVAYGALTGRLLNAQYQQESWSGIGLVRNAGDPNQTSQYPLPTRYPFIIPASFSEPWSFSSWVPQAVVINLGTNDFSSPPVPSQVEFENAYIEFIKNLTLAYNPHPKFFLVCGPMEHPQYCPYTQNVATQLGQTYVSLQGLLASSDWGCDGHPGVSGHAKMANVTADYIKQVLGW